MAELGLCRGAYSVGSMIATTNTTKSASWATFHAVLGQTASKNACFEMVVHDLAETVTTVTLPAALRVPNAPLAEYGHISGPVASFRRAPVVLLFRGHRAAVGVELVLGLGIQRVAVFEQPISAVRAPLVAQRDARDRTQLCLAVRSEMKIVASTRVPVVVVSEPTIPRHHHPLRSVRALHTRSPFMSRCMASVALPDQGDTAR